MTVATSRPETDALLAALRAAHPRVGDGQAPTDKTLPYAVLYPAGPGELSGSASDPLADGRCLFQITCVGQDRLQAQALADRLRPVALGPLTITGRKQMQSFLETSQPVARDDSSAPPLFYAVDQVRLWTTPA